MKGGDKKERKKRKDGKGRKGKREGPNPQSPTWPGLEIDQIG